MIILSFFFKINDLLHGAHRQTMADTLYLLIITNREEIRRRKEIREEGTKEGTNSCAFAPWSCAKWDIQPLSKQKVVGLLLRKLLIIDKECRISYDNLKGYPIATSFLSIYSYVYLDTSCLWKYSFSLS